MRYHVLKKSKYKTGKELSDCGGARTLAPLHRSHMPYPLGYDNLFRCWKIFKKKRSENNDKHGDLIVKMKIRKINI